MGFDCITAVYFSPTGASRRLAECASRELGAYFGARVSELDLTPPAAREKSHAFGEGDLVVFSMPVYAGRLPNKILPCIQTQFCGGGARALLLCSYGNRSFGDALTEMRDELTANGFRPFAAAAMVSEHAFAGALATGRPDAEDLRALAAFARRAAKRAEMPPVLLPVAGNSPAGPYYTPLGEDGQPAKFLKAKPKTDADCCAHCGLCAAACPMGSIETDGITVSGVCIKCYACVRKCPQGAKYFDDPAFLSHRAMLLKHYTARQENSFFL